MRIVEVGIEISLRLLMLSSSLVTHLLRIIDDELLTEEVTLLELNLCAISSSLLSEHDKGLPSQSLSLAHPHLDHFPIGREEQVDVSLQLYTPFVSEER